MHEVKPNATISLRVVTRGILSSKLVYLDMIVIARFYMNNIG